MTWKFKWIGMDWETFNDEHDQMSGALVWYCRTKHTTVGFCRSILMPGRSIVASITQLHLRYSSCHLKNQSISAARTDFRAIFWLQGSQ